MSNGQFLRTTLVLPVSDIAESVRWYEPVLGLEAIYLHEDEDGDEPANYAILKRDSVEVHLILDEPAPHQHAWTKAGTGYLYLMVRNVDELFAEVTSRDATVTRGLQTENWGSRGFNLTDPSGNMIHIEQAD